MLDHGRDAAGRGRHRAGREVLALGVAGILEVRVHVDRAGHHDEPGGVDQLVRRAGLAAARRARRCGRRRSRCRPRTPPCRSPPCRPRSPCASRSSPAHASEPRGDAAPLTGNMAAVKEIALSAVARPSARADGRRRRGALRAPLDGALRGRPRARRAPRRGAGGRGLRRGVPRRLAAARRDPARRAALAARRLPQRDRHGLARRCAPRATQRPPRRAAGARAMTPAASSTPPSTTHWRPRTSAIASSCCSSTGRGWRRAAPPGRSVSHRRPPARDSGVRDGGCAAHSRAGGRR